MAHCPNEQLADLEPVFVEMRRWPHAIEAKPGVFYIKRVAFLHFHLQDGRRWADARCGKDWGPSIDIPLGATRAVRAAFLRTVRRYYDASVASIVRRR